MRGRKPKPTADKILCGNPGRRPLNDSEPQPRRVLPACPSHLSREAKAEWRRMARDLYDAGLLTAVDRNALAMYCDYYATYVRNKRLSEGNEVILTKDGNFIQHPALAVKNRAAEMMMKLGVEFGMTPSSRARIHVEKPEHEQSMADILFAGVLAQQEEDAGD